MILWYAKQKESTHLNEWFCDFVKFPSTIYKYAFGMSSDDVFLKGWAYSWPTPRAKHKAKGPSWLGQPARVPGSGMSGITGAGLSKGQSHEDARHEAVEPRGCKPRICRLHKQWLKSPESARSGAMRSWNLGGRTLGEPKDF